MILHDVQLMKLERTMTPDNIRQADVDLTFRISMAEFAANGMEISDMLVSKNTLSIMTEEEPS